MTEKNKLTERELLCSGHGACPGCSSAIAMKWLLSVFGEKTILTIPACCWTVLSGTYPTSSMRIPLWHTAFETAAASASGIRAALKMMGINDVKVVGWAGDGGTLDIGLQALSAAAERNEDILYICYDNEAYMNTGIQRSSATPFGAWTTITLRGKPECKKDIMGIMAAHRIPYAATATIAYKKDFFRKILKAKELTGFRFIHILSPCPPGWKFDSGLSVKMSRLAVQTRFFPLYEIENGEKYTVKPVPDPKPVEEYLKLQGRYKHLFSKEIPEIQRAAQISKIQRDVDRNWERLQKLVSINPV